MEKLLPHISCLSFICVGAVVVVRVIIMQVVCSNLQHVTTLIESTLFGCIATHNNHVWKVHGKESGSIKGGGRGFSQC